MRHCARPVLGSERLTRARHCGDRDCERTSPSITNARPEPSEHLVGDCDLSNPLEARSWRLRYDSGTGGRQARGGEIEPPCARGHCPAPRPTPSGRYAITSGNRGDERRNIEKLTAVMSRAGSSACEQEWSGQMFDAIQDCFWLDLRWSALASGWPHNPGWPAIFINKKTKLGGTPAAGFECSSSAISPVED